MHTTTERGRCPCRPTTPTPCGPATEPALRHTLAVAQAMNPADRTDEHLWCSGLRALMGPQIFD